MTHVSKYLGVPIILKDGNLSLDSSLIKRCHWYSSLSVFFLRTLQGIAAVTLCLTVDGFFNPLFISMYLVVVLGSVVAFAVAILALYRNINELVLTWNAILKYKSQVKPPTLQILILHFFPITIKVAGWSIAIFLAFNSNWMIQFRFGVTWALAEGHLTDGWWGYYTLVAVCTFMDFWSLLTFTGILCITVPFHMLFMETWTRVITELVQSCKKNKSRIAPSLLWRRLQQLLVMLCIFNVGNASTVLAFKLCCLITPISAGSALILMNFHDNVILLLIMSYTACSAPFAYPAICYNAYGVTRGLELAKTELLTVPQTVKEQALIARRLRSVSTKGIWVGSLRTFERESLLIFFDFVIRTIVSIVLACK